MGYIKTNWIDGETPINATNLNKIENGISDVENAINGAILYDNPTGSADTITLNDSLANYLKILVEYKANTYGYKTMEVLNPNSKNIVLDYISYASNTVIQVSSSIFQATGNQLVYSNSCMINHQTNGSVVTEIGNKLIKITKVIGYK